MEEKCANKILLNELRPWLVEFGKLGTRGKQVLDLIELYTKADNTTFWNAYINNLMTEEDRKAFNAHKSGTMKMQSFYENAMDDLLKKFYIKLTGKLPLSYRAIGSFKNLNTIQSKLMFDNDSTTFYTSGTSQDNQSWIGADLGNIKEITEISILQGRNSVDDVDYFDNAVVEYSEDGKSWMALTDSLHKQYVINWSGTPVKAKYVRLKRLSSNKSNWAAVRSFEVNPIKVEKLNFRVEADDLGKALFAFDKNPFTSYVNNGILSFTLPQNVSGCTLLLKPNSSKLPLKLLQYASDNKLLAETTIDAPFVKIEFAKGTEKVEINGVVEIFEIIF